MIAGPDGRTRAQADLVLTLPIPVCDENDAETAIPVNLTHELRWPVRRILNFLNSQACELSRLQTRAGTGAP